MSSSNETIAIREPAVLAVDDAIASRRSAVMTFGSLVLLHSLLDCFAGVFPIFKHISGMSLDVAGAMASVAVIISWTTQPLFGVWADRGHMRSHILLGVALTFPMMFLGPIGTHMESLGLWAYALIFAALFSGRMGQAMFHPAGGTVAGNSLPARRSTLVAIFVAFGWLGYGVSQWLFSAVHHAAAGHTEWLLVPGGVLLALGFISCRPEEEPRQFERPRLGQIFATLYRTGGGIVPLFLCLAAMSALGQGLLFLLPEFVAFRGYPYWMVHGGALMCFVAGSALAIVPAGYLADRAGKRTVLIGSLVLSLAAYVTLVTTPSVPLPAFGLLCMATGGLMNVANPVGVAIGQHIAPGSRSMVTGVLMGLAWAMGGFAPLTMGIVAEQGSVISALSLLALVNVIAIPLAMLIPRY